MNATEFLPFMGHSSVYPPFDDFLTKNGITKRPNIVRRLDTTIFVFGHGLSLSFDFGISATDKGFVAKSDGTFVFKRFEVVLIAESKKNGRYVGPLPLGLRDSDSRETIKQKLGQPARRNDESDNYYLDELVWTVAFEGDKFQFIQFELPDDGKRKYNLCP